MNSRHTCCICNEPITEARGALENCPSHYFCIDCIRKWLNRNPSCPMCRIYSRRLYTVPVDANETSQLLAFPVQIIRHPDESSSSSDETFESSSAEIDSDDCSGVPENINTLRDRTPGDVLSEDDFIVHDLSEDTSFEP